MIDDYYIKQADIQKIVILQKKATNKIIGLLKGIKYFTETEEFKKCVAAVELIIRQAEKKRFHKHLITPHIINLITLLEYDKCFKKYDSDYLYNELMHYLKSIYNDHKHIKEIKEKIKC